MPPSPPFKAVGSSLEYGFVSLATLIRGGGGGRGKRMHMIMKRLFEPQQGKMSEVFLQLVAASLCNNLLNWKMALP